MVQSTIHENTLLPEHRTVDDISLPAVVLNPRLSNDSNRDDQVF